MIRSSQLTHASLLVFSSTEGYSVNSSSTSVIGNVTLADMGTLAFNQSDLGISAVFLFIFIVLALFITGMGIHQRIRRERLKRNQQIMIGLILVMLILQSFGLISRIVEDGMVISFIERTNDYVSLNYANNSSVYIDTLIFENSSIILTNVGIGASELIGMNVMNGGEVAFCLSNLSLFLLIMAFVGNVFLETVKLTIGGSETFSKRFKVVNIAFNISTAVFATTFVILSLTISILMPFFSLKVLEDFQVYIYIACFVIFVIQIVLQTIITTVSGLYNDSNDKVNCRQSTPCNQSKKLFSK